MRRMTTGSFPFGDFSRFDDEAFAAVLALKGGVQRTIGVTRALVAGGRMVDLTGLDRGVGLLCAKALDLPIDRGRDLQPHLVTLRLEVEALTQALRDTGPR